ncbi:MAG: RagB/SusD family nutrient uptake outer membrane protein [Bacteroidetes bacterium]|nr:RagB/SusD family nutrient uptake outer membrane protein [Bacteroidota bacterium]
MNKKLLIFTFILTGLLFQSCEQFLVEELRTNVTANNYYVTASGYEDGVKAMYWTLDRYWGSEMGMTMAELGTDYHTNGADGSHKGFNVYDSRLSPTGDSYSRDLWNEMYRAINQCNAIVGRAADVADMSQDLKDQRVAEARFLRGLYYFTLAQTYGNIHLSLEETKGIETTANQHPAEDIYNDAIIPDLEAAASVLPTSQSDYGRPTKQAAEFLLAKAVLTRGWLTNSTADFSRAQTLMEGVINNYGHELLPVWGDLWKQDNQVNSEVIWSVQNTTDLLINASLGSSGNRFHLYFLMEYDKLPGMTRDTDNGRPWKRARPTPWAETLYNDDPATQQALGTRADVRYQQGYKHVWYANNPGTFKVNDAAGERDIVIAGIGDTALFLPHIEVPNEKRLNSQYRIYAPSEYTEIVFPSLNKFIDPIRDNRQREEGSRDFIMARLADAYLIAAEAALKAGNQSKAAEYVNVVRARAARPGREADMVVAEADVNLDYILDERARELSGEMHRWYDLTRTGKLIERVTKYNAQAAPNIKPHHVLRPIPQTHIDAVNGEYTQNDGY